LVCGGPMEIQTPAPIVVKFSHISLPVQGRLWCWFDTRPPHPLGLGGPKTLKAE